MNEAGIDLTNTNQGLPPIDLGNAETVPALPKSVMSARASKAEFGLSQQTGQKYPEINDQFTAGKEQDFRVAAAASVDHNKLTQFSQGKIPATDLLQRSDPNTVIENNYAAEWVKRMYNVDDPFNGDTHMLNAQQDIPEHVRLTAKKASNIVSIAQQLNSAAEEMEAKYGKEGYGPFIAHQIEGAVPFFTQHLLKGHVPGAEGKWLPGNDIDEQSQALFRMDPWDAAKVINDIKTNLGNYDPGITAYFLRQLQSQSDSDRVMQNELGILDMSAVAGLGLKVVGMAKSFNAVREATQDVVHDGAKLWTGSRDPLDPDIAAMENEGGREPPEKLNATSRGDLETAALHKVTEQLQQELEGKPVGIRRAIEAMTSEHRIDTDALTNDERIGPDERELANRLADSMHRRDLDIVDAFSRMMRPDREPLVEEKTDILRVAEQKIRDDYKGTDNQIGDIDTHYDPFTNTRYHVIEIIQPDGKLFPEKAVAEENARINGFVLESKGLRWDKRAKLYKNIAAAEDRLARGPSPEEIALEAEGGPAVSEDKLRKNIEEWKKQLNQGPEEGFRVQRKGNGWYIEYTQPRKEWVRALTSDGKDAGYEIPANEAFQTSLPRQKSSLWNWFTTPAEQRKYARGETPYLRDDDQGMLNWMRRVMGWGRTGDETFARETREQLKIATHVTNVLKDLASGMVEEVQDKITSLQWNDFIRVLKAGQHWPDPDTGIPGYTFRTIPELNNIYQTFIHRLPSPAEVEGYFAWAHANDLDLFSRRIGLYVPKAIRGAEQFQFSVAGLEGRIKSGFVEAIERNSLPGGESNILVLSGPKGGMKPYKVNDPSFLRYRKSYGDKLNSGQAKVLEIVSPESFPLKSLGEVGKELIRYVLVEGTLERKPLSLVGQLPRRGGGHLIPDAEHYIKQANIHEDRVGSGVRHIMLGDNTVMPMYSRSSAVDITNKLNKIRQMIDPVKGRYPNIRAARDEFNNLKLPFSWNEFYGWFKPSRNPATGEMVPARLSTKEPFHALRKDETVYGQKDNGGLHDRYPHTFVNGTTSGSIARTIHVEFSGQRDAHQLMTVLNKGSEKNPLYSYQPTNLVDPITAQYRGLAKIINSTIMNDVKIHGMNKWLRDAQPWLQAKPNEIWHSPYTVFQDADKANAFRKETPWAIKQTLLANHMKLKKFLGVPSMLDNVVHSFSQTLADGIEGDTAPRLVARRFLHSLKDPIPFMRSMTYSLDMGLGSVKQYFTQATTFSNVMGMSPRAAGSASLGTLLHSYAYFNHTPEILDHLDKIATRLHSHLPSEQLTGKNAFIRYKPGYWKEARQLGIDSGFTTVDEEHALARDYPLSVKVVKSAGATILDWGRTPFTLGATQVRISAMHTAYLEFRELNPTGRLTRANKAQILDRATLLDHNMSRASNSILHTGWMSVPGQFFAYDLRLAEIMTGKRISPADKARLFATSSVLYGIGVGGLGLFGYPIGKYIEKKATEEFGYVAGAGSKLMDYAMNGAPSAIMNSITGRSYAFSKFGAKGVDYLEEFLASDKAWWKIIGGAVGSAFETTFKNSSNLYMSVMPEFAGGVPGMQFRSQYAFDVLKTAASYNEFDKMATAIYTGKWYSNNGQSLADDITIPNALFQAITGVPETRYSQKYLIDELLRDQNARERRGIALAMDNWGRYLQALKDNHDDADVYKNNTFQILHAYGFPSHRLAEAISALNKGHESTIRETNERYFKEAPEGQEKQRFEQFQQLQRRDLGQ